MGFIVLLSGVCMNHYTNGAAGGVMERNMIHDKDNIPRAVHHVGTADSLPERVDPYGRLFFSRNRHHWHDPHRINIIDSDQLLQAVPIPKLVRIIMQPRAVPHSFLAK
jgi:hypothetical protein